MTSLAILPNLNIVSGSYDTTINIWNGTSYELISTLLEHNNTIGALAVMPGSNNIVGDKFM
jgi:WD40 repeat protein